MDEQTLRKVYDAYKAGSLSPEASAQYEADIASGTISLPIGITSLTETPVTEAPETLVTSKPEVVKPVQQQIEEMKDAPILPEEVWKAFQSGQLSELASKDLFNDIYDGKWQIPYATTEEVSSSFGQDAFTTLQNIGRVYPVLDTIANAITSSYGVPVSGLAGILALPFGVENSKKTIDAVQKVLVHQPMTEGGEQLTEASAYPFRKLAEGGKVISEPIAEAGYPGTATAIQTAIEGAPVALTGKSTIRSVSQPARSLVRTGAERASQGLKAGTEAVKSGTQSALEAAGLRKPDTAYKPVTLEPTLIEITPEIKKTVRQSIAKAIKPPVSKTKTRAQANQYYDKATVAVEEIVKNKENLRIVDAEGNVSNKLPSTLDEFSQAIDQTRTNIFKEYDSLAKEADKRSVTIDLTKTAKELKPIFSDKILKDLSPETVAYARNRMQALTGREKWSTAVTGRKKYTATEAQEAIRLLNQSLDSYYKNPTPELKGKAYVDSLIANSLRDQLNAAIENATGAEYSALKKKYGALKTIERDVNKRVQAEMKKTGSPIIDLTNIATGSQAVYGLLKADPVVLASGTASKGISSYIKMRNEPSRIVRNMFEDVDKILSKPKDTQPSYIPLSVIFASEAIEQSGQEAE